LHDGDTFQLRGGDSPLFAEFLDTDGRRAFRVTNRVGAGLLFEAQDMAAFSVLLAIALDKPAPDSLEYMYNKGS
jgi:hypothetical protein